MDKDKMGRRGDINHIVVLRLSSMSSTAIAALAVAGLHKARPDMEITVVVRERYFPFFDGMGGVRLVGFDSDGYDAPGGILRLRHDILEWEADAVADLHGNLFTRILCRLLMPWQCRTANVDNGREGKALLTRKFRKVFVQQRPTVMRYCDVMERLGVRVTPCLPERKAAPLTEAIAARAGGKHGVWVGVAPFAAYNGKIYPLKYTDRLVEMLCGRYERVFLFGRGKYERQFAEAMELRHEHVVSTMDKLNLAQELDLMGRLDVVVTMDSAPMHMAALTGTRTVSIWGATHPYAGYGGFGQPEESMVQTDMACRPCSVNGHKRCMFGDYACMNGITPEQVADRVDAVLHMEWGDGETKA